MVVAVARAVEREVWAAVEAMVQAREVRRQSLLRWRGGWNSKSRRRLVAYIYMCVCVCWMVRLASRGWMVRVASRASTREQE